MASENSFSRFNGTRARFQRLASASIHSGWVDSFKGPSITVRAQGTNDFEEGDLCYFEVVGFGVKANFTAAFAGVDAFLSNPTDARVGEPARLHRFDVVDQICIAPFAETARVRTNHLHVEFDADNDIAHEGEVYDVSEGGLAISTDSELPRNSEVSFAIETHLGKVIGHGRVVYSRPDGEHQGRFRTGIQLSTMSRIDRPRWRRFVQEAA